MRWRTSALGLSWLLVIVAALATLLGSSGLGVTGDAGTMAAGYSDSFNVTCANTATLIQSPFGQVGYNAFVDDAAAADIFIGDSAVTTSIGHAKGAGEEIGGSVRLEYCIVASGTETLHVRAKVSTNPASLIGSARLWWAQTFSPEMFAARVER